MGKFFNEISSEVQNFIGRQKIFFVATAPGEGRINLSPKGMDCFRILDNRTTCFLNLTGSGNETAAHLLADGRMTVMFCGFEQQPLIVRLYGQGRLLHPRDDEWGTLVGHFADWPGKRQIVVTHVESVHTSCGYGVPFFSYQREREQLLRWAEKKGDAGIRSYWEKENQVSIDGLPTHILP
ncbi:MAG: pyridoxamine 5'-phosphate oxidase family protein [Magnetococcales bacterium]|nr:pyridoxamine 5'-phosphate oxidase family protein [Magnetococcales bacterium]